MTKFIGFLLQHLPIAMLVLISGPAAAVNFLNDDPYVKGFSAGVALFVPVWLSVVKGSAWFIRTIHTPHMETKKELAQLKAQLIAQDTAHRAEKFTTDVQNIRTHLVTLQRDLPRLWSAPENDEVYKSIISWWRSIDMHINEFIADQNWGNLMRAFQHLDNFRQGVWEFSRSRKLNSLQFLDTAFANLRGSVAEWNRTHQNMPVHWNDLR